MTDSYASEFFFVFGTAESGSVRYEISSSTSVSHQNPFQELGAIPGSSNWPGDDLPCLDCYCMKCFVGDLLRASLRLLCCCSLTAVHQRATNYCGHQRNFLHQDVKEWDDYYY